MKANVVIVILSLNGIQLLKECLNSIKRQTILPNKIIVLDNGSTDQTSELIQRSFEIEMIKIKNNLGIPKAFNIALNRCNSDYIAWLNNDVTLDSFWLEEMYSFIKRPKLPLVTPW